MVTIQGVSYRARKAGLVFWLVEEFPDLLPGDCIEYKGILYRVLDNRRSFFNTRITVEPVS